MKTKRRKKRAHRFGPPVLLRPGDLVRKWEYMHGTQEDGRGDRIGKGWAEYGRIVHVYDSEGGWQNCWIAFFGARRPPPPHKKPPKQYPYFLQYMYSSLELLERPGEDHTVLTTLARIQAKVEASLKTGGAR